MFERLLVQHYVAPEVLNGRYRPAPADMWSLGVVTYMLMSGSPPFQAESVEGIKRRIMGEGIAWLMRTLRMCCSR